MPTSGPHLPLRPRAHADGVREADVREADPDLAGDLDRPGAVHPLLPLHALQRVCLRGPSARRRQPRRADDDRDLRGPAVHRRVHRQRHRALPRRRAAADAAAVRDPALGAPGGTNRLRALPGRLQHRRRPARGQGQARPLAQPSRGRRGLALRQGPVRLRAPLRGRPDHGPAPAGPAPRARGGLVGGRRRRSRAPAARGRGPHRRRALVLGDEPVVERAPIVDLWIRKARRGGAEVVTIGAAGDVQVAPGTTAQAARDLRAGELGARLHASERAILIWSGGGAGGGSHLAALARELRFADKPGSGAFFLPETANGRGVAEAWAAASDEEGADPEPLGLLIVSGDEAAANPNVRALAERAERVIAITMFHSLAVGWADLVLPGTSYLEREG